MLRVYEERHLQNAQYFVNIIYLKSYLYKCILNLSIFRFDWSPDHDRKLLAESEPLLLFIDLMYSQLLFAISENKIFEPLSIDM